LALLLAVRQVVELFPGWMALPVGVGPPGVVVVVVDVEEVVMVVEVEEVVVVVEVEDVVVVVEVEEVVVVVTDPPSTICHFWFFPPVQSYICATFPLVTSPSVLSKHLAVPCN